MAWINKLVLDGLFSYSSAALPSVTGKVCPCAVQAPGKLNWWCKSLCSMLINTQLCALSISRKRSHSVHNGCLSYCVSFPWFLHTSSRCRFTALFPCSRQLQKHDESAHERAKRDLCRGLCVVSRCELSEPSTRLSSDTKHFLISGLLFPVRSIDTGLAHSGSAVQGASMLQITTIRGCVPPVNQHHISPWNMSFCCLSSKYICGLGFSSFLTHFLEIPHTPHSASGCKTGSPDQLREQLFLFCSPVTS